MSLVRGHHESHPSPNGGPPGPDRTSVHPGRRGQDDLAMLVPARRVAASLWRMCASTYCETALIPLVPTIHRGVAADRPFSFPATDRATEEIHLHSAIPENGNVPAKSRCDAWLRGYQLVSP